MFVFVDTVLPKIIVTFLCVHFCLQKNVSGAFCLWVCVVVASCLCGCSFLFDGPAAAAEIFFGHISKIPKISVEEPVKRGGKKEGVTIIFGLPVRGNGFMSMFCRMISQKKICNG